jgi:hypothetical protein
MDVDPYLVGILYGDGSISKRKDGAYAIWIDQAEINKQIIYTEVVPRMQKLGHKVFAYKYYAKKDKTWKHRALVYSKQIYEFLRETFADISAYIRGLTDDEARSFIAGLLDAEGTVTDRVVIYNGDRKLLKAVRAKLVAMGFDNVYIYKYGTVEGIQIYKRSVLKKLFREIPSLKLRSNKDKIFKKVAD